MKVFFPFVKPFWGTTKNCENEKYIFFFQYIFFLKQLDHVTNAINRKDLGQE